MNDATQILRNEHDVILQVLDATERVAGSLQAGADVPPQVLANVVEFLRLYADRQHHGKEEDLLFLELERRGMPREGGPIGMMLMEHKFGRALIARMAEAGQAYAGGDRSAAAQWAGAAADYVALLREHIMKENQILFVMAERMLTPDEQKNLAARFAEVDRQKTGESERLLRLADSLIGEAAQRARA